MSRLCIYLIYDTDKIVDDYIGTALKELKKFSDRLVVVCNFDHIENGEENIIRYADEVYYRENCGFDAGGYRETLEKFITWEKVYEYDELLLSNDTWFGPIYPFDEMVEKMCNDSCDFWGVTRHTAGHFSIGEMGDFPSHIQSYFLNFKYNVLHSNEFKGFWDNYVVTNDKQKTVENFEIGINECLSGNDFSGKAYTDLYNLPFDGVWNVSPYASYSYELVRDIKMPMVKKSLIEFDNPGYVNALKAFEYIKSITSYDYSLIEKYIKRKYDLGRNKTYYDFNEMEIFVNIHKRVFVYGHGVWAKILSDYFEYRNWNFDGYLVSDNKESDITHSVYCFNDMYINRDDGIIIALRNKNVCDAILKNISPKVSSNNILIPNYK